MFFRAIRGFLLLGLVLLPLFLWIVFLLIMNRLKRLGAFNGVFKSITRQAGIFFQVGGATKLSILLSRLRPLHARRLDGRSAGVWRGTAGLGGCKQL